MAAARGLPIPPADEVPPELEYRMSPRNYPEDPRASDRGLKNLNVPVSSKPQSFTSDASPNLSPHYPTFSLPSPTSPLGSPPSSTPLFRTRAKTLASLTTSSKNSAQTDMTPREFQLPVDPFVNGQPIEAYLYKDACECPICFLYYPPYFNTTRCCDQPICSECFVQIKRPDPHPPEHEQPDSNADSSADAEREEQVDGQLVSEVAACPFCKQPEFGITYVPPMFRRGLTYGTGSHPYQIRSAMSSQTSVSSSGMSPGPARRRATSLSVNAPGVVTTDRIRPDWATKLASARAHAARRSAAATALHTAAYLMGGNGQPDARGFGPFGRRGLLRRPTLEGDGPGGPNTATMNALALLAERHTSLQQEQVSSSDGQSSPFIPPPRGSSSRRSRMEDLEDMMMMEAIRLSLASEEERRKKEEKEAKKEAKKKEKETKKAEKAAKKSGLYSMNSFTGSVGPDGGTDGNQVGTESGASSTFDEEIGSSTGKGKGVDRAGSPPIGIPIRGEYGSSSGIVPVPGISLSSSDPESNPHAFPFLSSEPSRKSHLRHMSNASSSASSFADPASSQAFTGSSTPPGGGAGIEPMFNFRSLAAMIGDEEKGDGSTHVEQPKEGGRARSFEEIESHPGDGATVSSAESGGSSRQENDLHSPGKLNETAVDVNAVHENRADTMV